MNKIKYLALATLLVPALALAEDPSVPETPAQVIEVIQKIGNWLFTGLLIFSVMMLIIAAYKYLFSQGSEEAIGSAKNTIVYTVIALAVAMLAKGVPAIVKSIISVK